MSEIKAIETVYNGYKFRSRLEARWAVFFDAAGIKYEYEPEGFELSDGTKYLPDFYLPEYDWFVEVKPNRDGAVEDIERARRFIGDKIKVLLILGNIPKKTDFDIYHYPVLYYNNLTRTVYKAEVCLTLGSAADQEPFTYLEFDCTDEVDREFSSEIDKVRRYNFDAIHDREIHEKMWHFIDLQSQFGNRNTLCDSKCFVDTNGVEFINSCYDKARKSRFEHGQTPNVNNKKINSKSNENRDQYIEKYYKFIESSDFITIRGIIRKSVICDVKHVQFENNIYCVLYIGFYRRHCIERKLIEHKKSEIEQMLSKKFNEKVRVEFVELEEKQEA